MSENKNSSTVRTPVIAALIILTIILIGSFLYFSGRSPQLKPETGTGSPDDIRSQATSTDKPHQVKESPDAGGVPPGMVYVPGGKFVMGSGENEELPKTEVTLQPFYIDKYPVTVGDYLEFEKATGYSENTNPLKNELPPNTPMTFATYRDMEAYAEWKGKRLPTEAEWEMAARGTDGRIYPWGNEWKKDIIDPASKFPHEIGKYPESKSIYGAEDMVGNVFHMTCSGMSMKMKNPNKLGKARGKIKIVKGGGFNYFPQWNRSTFRTIFIGIYTSPYIGFRCVQPVDKSNDLNFEIRDAAPQGKGIFSNNTGLVQLIYGLVSPTRKIHPDLEEDLKLDKKGKTIADVGCGIGYLSYRLSEAVGSEGKVYAVDINQDVLDFVDVMIKEERIKNIITVRSDVSDIKLPPDSCDELYVLGTFHCFREIEPLREFIKSCRKALKKGGRMIVIEQSQYPMVYEVFKEIPSMGFQETDVKPQLRPPHLSREERLKMASQPQLLNAPADDDPTAVYIKR